MSDLLLRELERATREDPGDDLAKLRLERERLRQGRITTILVLAPSFQRFKRATQNLRPGIRAVYAARMEDVVGHSPERTRYVLTTDFMLNARHPLDALDAVANRYDFLRGDLDLEVGLDLR